MTVTIVQFVKQRGLEIALAACMAYLGWLVYPIVSYTDPGAVPNLQNKDFPNTYINLIHLDLTSPNHWVRLTWFGPQAEHQETGSFRSSPGAGWGTNDCNDPVESNCPGSHCTPKGVRKVEGSADHLRDTPQYRYVTWIDKRRAIGFHSCTTVEPYPASSGCVRLEPYAARLIHDNSIVGKTEILIDGTWTKPKESVSGEW